MEIKIENGVLRGIEAENYNLYKAIPYATAARFEEPRDVASWNEVFDATGDGVICYQGGQKEGSFYHKEFYSDDHVTMSEDCLQLNVWTPKNPKDCAVAVWFHGGGYGGGYNFEKEFDGEEYAKRGVILVTVNYRLGGFGFFCSSELKRKDGTMGNYGFLDQIKAVEWVYDNIGSFGGDNKNITVFGQSAGAMSVQTLVCCPRLDGKIRRVIIQSGNGYGGGITKGNFPMEKQAELTAKFLKKHKLSVKDVKSMNAEEFQSFYRKFFMYCLLKTRKLLMGPGVDGVNLPIDVDDAIKNMKTHNIDYMIGCNKDDLGGSGKKDRKKSKIFNCAEAFAKEQTAQGRRCYLYYFQRELKGDKAGAFHSAELWYMFGTLSRCWRPMDDSDYALSKQMVDDWCGFMQNGKTTYPEYSEGEFVKVYE